MFEFLIIFLVIIALLLMISVIIYNNLIKLRNQFKNSFSQIDVQLQRRYDLIPNLVDTAERYLKHEQDTLTAVIAARSGAVTAKNAAAEHPEDASAIKNLMGAESALTGALGKLFALSENYPELKANETMMRLMEELTSTENRVSFARQAYNDDVMSYNTYREKVPNNIFASSFNFKEAEPFVIENIEMKQPLRVKNL